jgi:integrase
MLRSQVPSLRLHRPSGQAVATIGGRDRYFGQWGPNKGRPAPEASAAYDQAISRWLAEGRPASWSTDSAGISIAELMLEYVRYADARYRRPDGTCTGHINNVKLALRPLRRLYARMQANEFNCLMLRACAVEAIADSVRPNSKTGKPRRKRPLARRVANQRARLIRRMFKWAAGRQLIDPFVPAVLQNYEAIYAGEQLELDGRHFTAQDPPPSRLVSNEDFRKTLKFLPLHVRALVEILRLTGARVSEICSMRNGDIDRAGETWIYRPRWHKNLRRGLPREIQIGPRCQEVLMPWIRPNASEGFVFSPKRTLELLRASAREERLANRPKAKGNRKRPKQDPSRVPGDRYNRNALLHAIRRAAKKAGVQPWSPGQLRHLRATELEEQFGAATAAACLGHATIDTTINHYIKLDAEKARSAAIASG